MLCFYNAVYFIFYLCVIFAVCEAIALISYIFGPFIKCSGEKWLLKWSTLTESTKNWQCAAFSCRLTTSKVSTRLVVNNRLSFMHLTDLLPPLCPSYYLLKFAKQGAFKCYCDADRCGIRFGFFSCWMCEHFQWHRCPLTHCCKAIYSFFLLDRRFFSNATEKIWW